MCSLVVCLPQALIKQDNLDAFNEKDPYKADDSRDDEDDNDDNDNSLEPETFPIERDEVMPPPIPHPPSERVSFPKGLPWAPKVRYCSVSPDQHTEFLTFTVEANEPCNRFGDIILLVLPLNVACRYNKTRFETFLIFSFVLFFFQ